MKTLKDLLHVNEIREADAVEVNELKQEAIKWIKILELNKLNSALEWGREDDKLNIKQFYNLDNFSPYRVILWIKYFFNLTEEIMIC